MLIRNLVTVPGLPKNMLTITLDTFFPLTYVDGSIIPASFKTKILIPLHFGTHTRTLRKCGCLVYLS